MWFQIEQGLEQLRAEQPHNQDAGFTKVIKSVARLNEQNAFRMLIHWAHLQEY